MMARRASSIEHRLNGNGMECNAIHWWRKRNLIDALIEMNFIVRSWMLSSWMCRTKAKCNEMCDWAVPVCPSSLSQHNFDLVWRTRHWLTALHYATATASSNVNWFFFAFARRSIFFFFFRFSHELTLTTHPLVHIVSLSFSAVMRLYRHKIGRYLSHYAHWNITDRMIK